MVAGCFFYVISKINYYRTTDHPQILIKLKKEHINPFATFCLSDCYSPVVLFRREFFCSRPFSFNKEIKVKELSLNEMHYISGGFNLFGAATGFTSFVYNSAVGFGSFVATSGTAFADFVVDSAIAFGSFVVGASNWQTFVNTGSNNWNGFVETAGNSWSSFVNNAAGDWNNFLVKANA